MVKRVCVFCGSSSGARPNYSLQAERLGAALVRAGLGLVYGGASVGLMGRLADAVLAGGREVIGVIPQALVSKEVAHFGLADLRVVGSMHERKAVMADLSDAFIALPGGLGTLEEFFEILTWAQLGLHAKPCGLLDVDEYFGRLLGFLDHAVAEGFIPAPHRAMILVEQEPERLIRALGDYKASEREKWLDRDET